MKCGYLTFSDLNGILYTLVKSVQYSTFSQEIKNIDRTRSLPKIFGKLSIFLDDHDILRVDRRLGNFSLTYAQKNPRFT